MIGCGCPTLLMFLALGLLDSPGAIDQLSSQQRDDNPMAASERYFARNMYQRLSQASGGGNLVVSPLSLYLLLAVLTEGAVGSAQTQLLRVLGLDHEDLPVQTVRDCVQQLLTEKERSIQLVSRIFLDNTFPVNKDFLSIANKYYHTGVVALELAKKVDAAKIINGYVMDDTNDTIRDIITARDLSEDTSMVCINTIHVRDSWALPFHRGGTTKETFYISPEESVSVEMMHMRNRLHFLRERTLQTKILSLDLSTEDLRMVFFLPDENLWDLETSFSSQDLFPLLKEVHSSPLQTVDVWLPPFRIEGNFNLEKILQQMGLNGLFVPGEELTGVSTCTGLHLSRVRQKTHIVVEENGVEASAATAAVLANSMNDTEVQEFHADRAFSFYLLKGDMVVFQGRVVKPSQ